MHLVREMKKYGHVRVANAMFAIGWKWKNPHHRPTNIERMTCGLPRCDLEMILNKLKSNASA